MGTVEVDGGDLYPEQVPACFEHRKVKHFDALIAHVWAEA